MEFSLQFDCSNIDFNEVSNILKRVGMMYYEGELHEKAFENSYSVVFAFDKDKLIGFGRAISDGAYQSSVYDIAVLPEYQGKGIGKAIMEKIIDDLKKLQKCDIILFASPGKEEFYEKLNFKKMKTGLAIFTQEELMRADGFIE